jgi:hypothetical protein
MAAATGGVGSGYQRVCSGSRWAQEGLNPICLLDIVPATTMSLGILMLFTLYEDVRGFGLRHGGGGHLLCRRWSTGVLWLDCQIF